MIITAKPLSPFFFRLVSWFIDRTIKRSFNKVEKPEVHLLPGHSYLLMCNHFSFWDGIFAFYICNHGIRKHQPQGRLYIMSLEKQMKKNPWLRYAGSFSVSPGTTSVAESIRYAAEILNTPGNILLMYPQGQLESLYVRKIKIQEGIGEIIPAVKGKCQLIWSSNLIEYMESLKPSLYFKILDCGTNAIFNFAALKETINLHHYARIKEQFRFTREEEKNSV